MTEDEWVESEVSRLDKRIDRALARIRRMEEGGNGEPPAAIKEEDELDLTQILKALAALILALAAFATPIILELLK